MAALTLHFMLLHLIACSISDIRYIHPTGFPPSSCPDQHCVTLYHYSQSNNFTTGTTLLFLPGNHSLPQSTLNITSVSNITLRGESVANIICTNMITIQCENVMYLKIEGLRFLLNYTGIQKYQASALRLINCDDVFICNTTFDGSGDVNTVTLRAITLVQSKSTIKGCGFKGIVGGAIHAQDGTNLTICGCYFTRNKGTGDGGAINGGTNSIILLDGSIPNIFDHNTDRNRGGAIYCFICTLEMSGNNTFKNNSALYYRNMFAPNSGGALYVNRGKLIISGTACISNSMATIGGAVHILDDSQAILNGALILKGNLARSDGGGMCIQQSSVITLTKSSRFIDNVADTGGALSVDNYRDSSERGKERKKIILSGDFVNNTAYDGGAVHVASAQITFTDTNMISNSNAALSASSSDITFNGTTRIVTNSGGTIQAEHSSIVFENDTVFESNSSPSGGGISCLQGTVSFRGCTLFTRNKADSNGGAIYAVGTSIHMQDQVNFSLNTAGENGGAMYLDTGATLTLKTFTTSTPWNQPSVGYTQLSTSENLAHQYGGGIYYVDSPTTHQCHQVHSFELFKKLPYCFLQAEPFEYDDLSSIEINSQNDLAGVDGNFLYGGLLDRCRLNTESWELGTEMFTEYKIITISSLTKGKGVTSKPYDLCFCDNNETTTIPCRKTVSVEVYRGQEFTVSLLAIAQVGTTSTAVTAITSSKAKLEIYQTTQLLPDYCYLLTYTLYSSDTHEQVVLFPNGPCRDSGLAKVVINATLLLCPNGFTQYAEICTCEERLHRHDVNCTIADVPYITKAAGSKFWMDVLYTNTTYQGLVLGKLCPLEYCKTGTVHITLDNPDIQCDLHRSGVLCGACAANHSLMLGSSQCQVCSNTYLTLLFPFAAAGIALVVFLTVLRLTIATGSLNSVILYANIVQVNRKLFFPINTRNVLTVFVAWMNLDLGFQTCFYDGLDAYACRPGSSLLSPFMSGY